MSFHYESRVYYSDTDCEGIAYHARYLDWAEHARTEWMRSLFGSPSQVVERYHMLFVVKTITIEYHRPLKLDDPVRVESSPVEWGAFSFVLLQEIFSGEEKKATLKVKVACLDDRTLRPAKLPDTFVASFS
ncbi:MAG: YbgC/FadM family acyl-CoA thioesterase [Sphaerochaeta sp.]|jgi:acyl-CoA thioester hydrolase|nr:YbgC/FadM family acyl-CoA thioesterase [Sphaerochaeta sp.]MCH3920398.1 YbgC/FadM family acyl-CoA thioesterase [Sphaerochaeta sp.]MCI2044956.1 YbgC/FadM family acyl-CoA thioesterase [Sphaerochaeta sp.]MCI2076295.1 YbgC/FadM family acyl-CoA thioesterase [Sphaerochaeta sp.]MCI2096545.1 YbgC/FadM family acyl-CoA thioesterase [Sphaerochaeta sp.]